MNRQDFEQFQIHVLVKPLFANGSKAEIKAIMEIGSADFRDKSRRPLRQILLPSRSSRPPEPFPPPVPVLSHIREHPE